MVEVVVRRWINGEWWLRQGEIDDTNDKRKNEVCVVSKKRSTYDLFLIEPMFTYYILFYFGTTFYILISAFYFIFTTCHTSMH